MLKKLFALHKKFCDYNVYLSNEETPYRMPLFHNSSGIRTITRN